MTTIKTRNFELSTCASNHIGDYMFKDLRTGHPTYFDTVRDHHLEYHLLMDGRHCGRLPNSLELPTAIADELSHIAETGSMRGRDSVADNDTAEEQEGPEVAQASDMRLHIGKRSYKLGDVSVTATTDDVVSCSFGWMVPDDLDDGRLD